MTPEIAKERICTEFMDRYYEWLEDLETLDDRTYSNKYGYRLPNIPTHDNLSAVRLFQKHIFAGRYLPAWETAGYDKNVIWQLHRDKFLSLDESHSWQNRQLGREYFFYVSQNTAKEIYRKYKENIK